MRTRQKPGRYPSSSRTRFTRSASPIEAPPIVISTSASRAPSMRARRSSGSSRAVPSGSGVPPVAATSAATIGPFESGTPRPARTSSKRSGPRSSSPGGEDRDRGSAVDERLGATRRRKDADRARSDGVPFREEPLAAAHVLSRRAARSAPASRSSRTSTVPGSASASVSSTRTTVSAPGGRGAPVMIRTASPAANSGPGPSPARTCRTTRRRTGASALAPATSAPRTAKPSMALLSHGGSVASATTSSASARPRQCGAGRLGQQGRRVGQDPREGFVDAEPVGGARLEARPHHRNRSAPVIERPLTHSPS
jgi:hypothetical protein